MKKLILALIILTLFSATGFGQTSGGVEIFYDNFVDMDKWYGTIGAGNGKWAVTTTQYSNNTDASAAAMTRGTASIFNATSLYGYKDLNLSFWANTSGNDAGEGIKVSFWNGFAFTQIFVQQGDVAAWNYTSLMLDAQDVAGFILNFTCTNNGNGEQCNIDDVRINGFPSNWTQTMIRDAVQINSIAIGDANNDGNKDIVIGMASTTNEVRMYENKSGTWVETNIKDIIAVKSVAIGDVNNDGYNDVVIGLGSATTNEVRMYENKSGEWVETNISDRVNYITTVLIGDIDNDGFNETVYGSASGSDNITITKNISGGWVNTRVGTGLQASRGLAICDFNNDGLNEIINVEDNSPRISYYQNESGGWTKYSIINTYSVIVLSVACGDVNNDGKYDIITGSLTGTNELRMYENKSGGWVETNISDVPSSINSINIGDANNDGVNDVVIGKQNVTPNEYNLRMYENKSGGWVETNISDVLTTISSIVVGNITNSDRNHIVIGMASTNIELRAFNTSIPTGEAPPASYAFTITVPGGNYSNSSTEVPGGGNVVMNFTYNGTWGGNQYYVNCSYNYSGATYWQTSATPALQFRNLGTATLTWSITLNTSIPSWVKLFANDTNAIPLSVVHVFGTTPLQLSVAQGATKNLWVYANFTSVTQLPTYVNNTALNHTSA